MQSELIKITTNENGATIDSREVAEMLGKRHGDLLKDIQGSGKNLGIIPTLTKGNIPTVNYFIESTYIDSKGEERKCYLCTKMGCEMLGNKLRGEKGILFTAKYVEKFNAMERELKSQTTYSYMIEDPIARAKVWIKEEEERQALQLENKQLIQQNNELKPKADYTDDILKNPSLITITQISKDYGMSAKSFNLMLNDLNVQYKQSDQWFLYSNYQSFGYTHSETYKIKGQNGKEIVKMNTKWTQKGRLFLYNLLKEHDILPLIEQ